MTRRSTDAAAAPPLPSPKERRNPREAKPLSEEQVPSTKAQSPAPTPAPTPVEATGSTAMAPTEPGPTPELSDAPAAPAAPGVLDEPDAPAEAFDALYESCAADLFRQTFLLTGRRNLSQESVARAFALAWERWPEVAVDRDPASWVRAAAYEYAMSPWHRLRRTHRQLDPPPAEPGARALLDALLDLPPSYRRTLLLYDGVGLDLPETAAETEASTPAAASRLMNARAAVAEQLSELAEPSSPPSSRRSCTGSSARSPTPSPPPRSPRRTRSVPAASSRPRSGPERPSPSPCCSSV